MRSRVRIETKTRMKGLYIFMISLLCAWTILPTLGHGQEINPDGWPVPHLGGLIPYSISVKKVDGVEKMVERFYTPSGGNVARISGNGKVFAYAVDKDQDPPIDYFLVDPDGSGKFTQKFRPEAFYAIPEWLSY